MRSVHKILAATALAILVPALALAVAPADPAAEKLRHNLAVFRSLPAERQEALRKLERDLKDEPAGARQRLDRVMERYVDWLQHLSEVDRQYVVSAPDRKTRLARIREVRDKQWLQRQPRGLADKIAKTPDKDRPAFVQKLRQEELDERLDWLAAQRHWDALRSPGLQCNSFKALPADVRDDVEKNLLPLLSREQEKRLKDAEGKWPRFPRILVELADSHPPSVLGPIGPLTLKDWPLKVEGKPLLEHEKKVEGMRRRLRDAEGKWPDYGVAVRDIGKLPLGRKLIDPLPATMMPARPADFTVPVQQFIDKKLLPALEPDEAARLQQTEGQWPKYPQLLVELAHKHNLVVPTATVRLEALDRYRWRPLLSASYFPPGRRGDPLGFMIP